MSYEFYKNVLAVPAVSLFEDNVIMSKSNYNALCQRGVLKKLRDGKGLGNHALVEFDTIPERFRVKIVNKLGYPPKKQVQHQILKYLKDDYEAIDFFATYELEENRTLSPEHQEQYCADAKMLLALDFYIKEMQAFRKSRGGSLTKIWDDAAQAVKEVKEQTGHNLPGTARRLKDKLESFKKEGYKSLISEKFLGQNAAKVKDTTQEAFLRRLLSDHRNLDNEQIARLYESTASVMGWKTLSASTIGNYRTKWKLFTYASNNGVKAFDNYQAMTVKRTAPTAPLIYWTLDGWDAELYYQKTENGLTTYHNRLTVVFVLDPSAKYPIGYAIGRAENKNLIKQAIRNAILHTEELFGAKHKVLQIQSDNYARGAMKPIYEAVAEKYTPAKIGNAKAKVIESWFSYFNKKYCQLMYNWSGFGVKSKTQPNPDKLNAIKKSFPDEQGAAMQLMMMIEREREEKREQYLKAYEQMEPEAKKLLSEKDFLLHFGEDTGYTNKRSHTGIAPKIEGIRYYYDSFDVNFRKYDHLEWQIKYNPNDLSQVLAYNREQGLSFLLQKKHEQPMALYDRSEGDGEQLAQIRNFNSSMKEIILEQQAEDFELINQLFTENKELDNTLAKSLLTDSRGQHKDQKNKQRLENAQKVLKKQEEKQSKEQDTTWNQEHENYLRNKVNLNKYIDND